MFKKNVIFCFFPFKGVAYTPLDLGYILSLGKKENKNDFKIEMVPHFLSFYESEADIKEQIENFVRKVSDQKAQAVFFFVDNINWSSIYAWGRAKKIAKMLRKKNPEIFIGVQSYKFHPDHIEKNSFSRVFDCLVGDYPEESFLLLEDILRKKKVAGVTYCDQKPQKCDKTWDLDADNLDKIPSPYMQGIFDAYLASIPLKDNFTSFVYSSRGCPFGCYYCPRSVKYEKVRFFSVQRFYDEIGYIHKKFGIKKFFVQDDAFVFSQKRMKEFLSEFQKRKRKSKIGEVRLFICARPEQLNEDIFRVLKEINVFWIQIGVQTVKPDLQKYMRRSMEVSRFQEIAKLAKKYDIKLFVDIIAGLPGDNLEFFKKTVDLALSLKPITIQAKQFYLAPNTLFFREKEKYKIETEKTEKDFLLPNVLKAEGVDQKYFKEAYSYLMEKVEGNPGQRWKIIFQQGIYMSPNTSFNFN